MRGKFLVFRLSKVEKFRENDLVCTLHIHTYVRNSTSTEKCYKPRSRFLRKSQHIFRESNVFTKKVTKDLQISRNFFSVIAFFHTVHS